MEESRKEQDKKQKESGYKATTSLISFLIENYVRSEPYITVISKKQLWYGNGILKNSPHPGGLMRSLDLKEPSNKKIEEARNFYNYPVMQKPYTMLNAIVNTAMKRSIINETLNGGEFNDIRAIVGYGYIKEDGKLDPEMTKGISCYVLYAKDERLRDIQNEWIKEQPYWKRLQIERNMATHHKHLEKQLKSALNKQEIIEQLMLQQEYKQLVTGISRNEIPWEMDE